jgi:D-sedoheptulose 7-phosphate isomerase
LTSNYLNKPITEHIKALESVVVQSKEIQNIIQLIVKSIKSGGKILFCGNGGSAADAQHWAAELLVRLRPHVNRKPIAALSLGTDTSTITACGNDYSFDDIFCRPFDALARKNDVLFIISTSGNSKNILKVLQSAKKKKIKTVGLLGKSGGKAKKNCDFKILVGSSNVARIQEIQIFLGHIILENVENRLLGRKN